MSPRTKYIVVFITATTPDEAEKIASALLQQRRAACVNTVPGVHSRFWWRDKLDEAEECLLIVKTRENLLPEVVKTVKDLHGNEVPEIIALPIIGGNRDYLDWLNSETA